MVTLALALLSLSPLFVFADPVLKLDGAPVTGFNEGSVSKFLGIPYAYPPVGPLRFRQTRELGPYKEPINATAYGPACPQQRLSDPFSGIIPSNIKITNSTTNSTTPALEESEDCLTINVLRPSFVHEGFKLPVVVWIHGGGFQMGYTAEYDDQAVRIVKRSVELDQPVIFVDMNYRLSAFGFLAGREVRDASVGNLGLVDQRTALRWVHRYIERFGGDKSKVTLWGQSAGATSIVMQMLAYGGVTENYFHAAFMQSGATLPFGSILDGQVYYDFIVEKVGCKSSNDTLNCLRGVEYKVLKNAIDATPDVFSYQSLVLTYPPRADGNFLLDVPQKLVRRGLVANIPIVSGNCDDEGTYFAFSTRNITSENGFRDYIRSLWFPRSSVKELEPLWSLYPSALPMGSPFNTEQRNELTPQFKRIAAFQGDVVFHSQRRSFLKQLSGKQKIWSYLSKQFKSVPYYGSYHVSDLLASLTDDYLINFINHHNPNTGSGLFWPEYMAEKPVLYTFPEVGSPLITLDDFRVEQLDFLSNITLRYPL